MDLMQATHRATLYLDWPGILDWTEDFRLGRRHISQGQPVVWHPSPGPTLSPGVFCSPCLTLARALSL